MNKKAALAGKLIRMASENPAIAKEAMKKAAALLKQGHPVQTEEWGKAAQSKHAFEGPAGMELEEARDALVKSLKAKGIKAKGSVTTNGIYIGNDQYALHGTEWLEGPGLDNGDGRRNQLRIQEKNPKKWIATATAAIVKAVKEQGKTAGDLDKQAAADTAAFAAWAIARGKVYTENECKATLDRLGVPFVELEDRAAPKRGPLAVGETVSPDAYNNSNEQNVDACKKYHKQFGEVEKVDRDGIAVRFDDGKLVRFYGENKPGKTLGLGRATRPSVVESRPSGRALIEVIYVSDKNAKPPTKSQIQQVLDYVEKGELKGESRNKSYYTGLALKQAEGKSGYYFTVFSQQRDKFPRSMNPKKGTVLYIGRLGGRPPVWKAEYEKMLAEVEGNE